MAIHTRPLAFAHLAIAGATTALLWVGSACNGILGNEVLDADAGANDAHAQDCVPGFAECAGKCVDPSEPANCGSCVACPSATPFCAPAPAGAKPPFACIAACLASQQECGQRCVDITTVPDCGACGNDCRGVSKRDPSGGAWACRNRKCVLDCTAGLHKCPAGVTCGGQDATSCGDSCAVCASGKNAIPQCVLNGGVYGCGFTCKASGPGPGGGQILCPTSTGCDYVDATKDPLNCGACGKKCATTLGCKCQSSMCVTAGAVICFAP